MSFSQYRAPTPSRTTAPNVNGYGVPVPVRPLLGVPSMRYLGGKSRQAGGVLSAVLEHREDRRRYVEPFVGGGSALARVARSMGGTSQT